MHTTAGSPACVLSLHRAQGRWTHWALWELQWALVPGLPMCQGCPALPCPPPQSPGMDPWANSPDQPCWEPQTPILCLRATERCPGSGDTFSLSKSPQKEVAAGGISLFSQGRSNRTKENGLKLSQGRSRLDIRKNFFTKKVGKCWNRLPREMAESPSPRNLKRHVGVALSDMV